MNSRLTVACLSVVWLLALGARSSEAGLILIQAEVAGNDCAGVLGMPFDECTVGGSPIIIKFAADSDGNPDMVDDINSMFQPEVTGDEWTFSGGGDMGSFSYNPGPGDPDIKFWAAKGSNAFNLQFFVTSGMEGPCSPGNELSMACLSLAQPVPLMTDIPWSTVDEGGGFPPLLSHLSFYNSGPDITDTPEPGLLLLLGSGLLGIAVATRRRTER